MDDAGEAAVIQEVGRHGRRVKRHQTCVEGQCWRDDSTMGSRDAKLASWSRLRTCAGYAIQIGRPEGHCLRTATAKEGMLSILRLIT